MATIAIYLDTCVYNRPFDDQTQPRIWLETLAFSVILQMVEDRSVSLITSSVIAYETSRNPDQLACNWIGKCTGLANHVQLVNGAVRRRAEALENLGFKAIDALHIACAEQAGADYFVTSDDRLIRRYRSIIDASQPLRTVDPLTFVRVVTGE